MQNKIELLQVAQPDKIVIRSLMQLYLYDFSEFTGSNVNHHGFFDYPYLDHYWTEPGRYPFLIKVNDHAAGFALVRKEINEIGLAVNIMAEFFVLRKYRRKKVGKKAAFLVFDRFPGKWRVSEIVENVPAQMFWRKIISEYTNGHYDEIQAEANTVVVQLFNSSQES